MEYYHAVIEKKEKSKKKNKMFAVDYSLEKIKNEIVNPYLDNKEFYVEGYVLTKKDIERIKIVKTTMTSDELHNKNNKRYSNSGVIYIHSKYDDIDGDDYTEDVTSDFLFNRNNDLNDNLISNNKNVFIVHGHNEFMIEKVSNFVITLGFKPIVLKNQASQGNTIIEKLEENSNVCFAIILYTFCDLGRQKNESIDNKRARQNVVFEHGFFTAKLGRKKVAVLMETDVEKPGDIDGVVYINIDKGDSWKFLLAKEMKIAGLDIDMNKLL